MIVNNRPLVSVVLPTHNAEGTLKKAINSVCGQTLRNWELICVDNASSDATVQMLKEYAATDSRIKVITHMQDEGLYWSRRDGIEAASGEYLMFLDADDWLEADACADLTALMEKTQVDLLHYRSNIVSVMNADPEMVNAVDEFIRPYPGRVENVDLINFCYAESRFSFSIWNKIYKTSIFKSILPDLEKAYIITGEDLILVFMYMWYAKTYYGDNNGKPYHNYAVGNGLSSGELLSLNSLRMICSGGTAAGLLQRFLEKRCGLPQYGFSLQRCKERLLNDSIYAWAFRIKEEDKVAGLKVLFEFWNPRETLPKMARDYGYLAAKIGSCARQLPCFQIAPRLVKTIGVMILRMSNGGIERVTSLLIPLWQMVGYRVVLLTEEAESEEDYPIPENVERIILPGYQCQTEFPYQPRCETLTRAIDEQGIDVIVNTQYYSVSNIWDAMAVRSMGIPMIIAVHNAFLQVAMYGAEAMDVRFPGYAMANALVTLSKEDQKTAEFLGCKSWYIPNPIDPRLYKVERAALDTHNILYMGRLEEQKRPIEMLQIFARVSEIISDAKLLVVGKVDSPEWEKKIRCEIERLGIGERVELLGFQKEPYPYLKRGSVLLMPSLFEGYPMVMLEAKAAGMPCVSFDMPYLEFQRYGKGLLVAEQGDIEGAAQHVIKLLSDEGYRQQAGREARESFEHFASFNIVSMWNEVFKKVFEMPADTFTTQENLRESLDIFDTYRFFRDIGRQNRLSEIETELNRGGVKMALKLHAIASMFRHVGLKGKVKIIVKLFLRCFGFKRPFYCEEYDVRAKMLNMLNDMK